MSRLPFRAGRHGCVGVYNTVDLITAEKVTITETPKFEFPHVT